MHTADEAITRWEGMLLESEFKNVTVGEQTWRYRDSGQGPPVVLFHGFPDTPQSYAGIARSLNEAGYRTILPYLRGYHPDTLVPGRSYDALSLAEDVVGLLDALGLESAVLVGHDWGATLVYGAAALAPDRVEAIVPIAIPHPRTLKPKNALQVLGLLVVSRHFLYFQLPWAEARTSETPSAGAINSRVASMSIAVKILPVLVSSRLIPASSPGSRASEPFASRRKYGSLVTTS